MLRKQNRCPKGNQDLRNSVFMETQLTVGQNWKARYVIIVGKKLSNKCYGCFLRSTLLGFFEEEEEKTEGML